MTRLPLLVSLPHAGLEAPVEVAGDHRLSASEIAEDGDVQAAEIYALREHVARFVTTPIARAFVDMNRAPDDIRKDGVVKTHTCWDVPVWHEAPNAAALQQLLTRYHAPYHRALSACAGSVIAAVDCHTMAAFGPPVGPDPGVERPRACIGVADGTCPAEWAEALADQLRRYLGGPVRINDPFKGGYIIRQHAAEGPWLMVELSRATDIPVEHKRLAFLAALTGWSRWLASVSPSTRAP